ncbi:phosphopyruvate hydratase [Neobacillus sp. 19]|uniref:phosphopyruvate hydratase n=1 Tax=Neobacillus sp. 19 TaxID=3394458 RepID=UPI003BF6F872
MMSKFIITNIVAREIIDCRWNPTVQVDVYINNELKGSGNVPSGRSTGSNEAFELRDGEKRYGGMGVQKAVSNVNNIIAKELIGMDVTNQRKIDEVLISLDESANKKNLGANALMPVSLACAYAAANSLNLPLYRYLNPNAHILPVPLFNLLNGGKLTSNDLDFQEFCIFPTGADSFKHALEIGRAVNDELAKIVLEKYGKLALNVGDEGGFATPITDVFEAMEVLSTAVNNSGYADLIEYGFDCAATHLYDKERKVYTIQGKEYDADGIVQFFRDLMKTYPIATIEDPMDEDDVEGFRKITQELGIQIVGDDFFCTNPRIMKPKIEKGGANALLWKFNQVGTLSEAIDAASLAYRSGYGVMVSERSGETEDSAIADLVVALDAGQIKTGAGVRGERTAKYNRLLQIEEELGSLARYAGKEYRNTYRVTK